MFDLIKKKISEFSKKVASEKNKELDTPQKKKNLSLTTKVKRALKQEVTLSDNELDSFLWEFQMALLEADVAQETAEQICFEMKELLSERKFDSKEKIESAIKEAFAQSLKDTLTSTGRIDLISEAKSTKPFVIMFLGPNGSGKTTSMAKIARLLQKNGLSSIFAASDTFRAASIEQLEEHAQNLNIRLIKHKYGADPAAVAFDAIKSAKANNIDCVLIDTAGRQETNKNLMEELKKISKVTNPNLKIYVDEAIVGNALFERVKQFKNIIGIDAIILSKMDLDAKGGGAISISKGIGVPILFIGTGQSYDDLHPFSAEELVSGIIG